MGFLDKIFGSFEDGLENNNDPLELIRIWHEKSEGSKERVSIENRLREVLAEIDSLDFFEKVYLNDKMTALYLEKAREIVFSEKDARVDALGKPGDILMNIIVLAEIPNLSLAGFVESSTERNPLRGKEKVAYKEDCYQIFTKRFYNPNFLAEERLLQILSEKIHRIDDWGVLSGLFRSASILDIADTNLRTFKSRDVVAERFCQLINRGGEDLLGAFSADPDILDFPPILETIKAKKENNNSGQ